MDALLLVVGIHTGIVAFAYLVAGVWGFDDEEKEPGYAFNFPPVDPIGIFRFFYCLYVFGKNWKDRPEARRSLYFAFGWLFATIASFWARG